MLCGSISNIMEFIRKRRYGIYSKAKDKLCFQHLMIGDEN